MVKKYFFILFFLFQVTIAVTYTHTFYDEFFMPGAESKGYVNALTSSYEGFVSLLYNPANAGLMKDKMESYVSKENFYLVPGISYMIIGTVIHGCKTPNIFLGISWRRFNYLEAVAYQDNENIVATTMAYKIKHFVLGMNHKVLFSSLAFPELSSSSLGYSLDMGINFIYNKFSIGCSFINLFSYLQYSDSLKDNLLMNYQMGASWKATKHFVLFSSAKKIENQIMADFAITYKIQNFKISTGISSQFEYGLGSYLTIGKFNFKLGIMYSFTTQEIQKSLSLSFIL